MAVANQKGGVAKTTTVASLGAASPSGPSGAAGRPGSAGVPDVLAGLDPEALEPSMHEVLLGGATRGDGRCRTNDGMALLPATIEPAATEAQLLIRTGRE